MLSHTIENIAQQYTWHATPSAHNGEHSCDFSLTTTTYDDFHKLCPIYQVNRTQFTSYTDQQKCDTKTILNAVVFITEKGDISSVNCEINPFSENPQRTLSLYYNIPFYERAKQEGFCESVKIGEILFPHMTRHSVDVNITPLYNLNEYFISKWSTDIYEKIQDFITYYVNMLAIENKEGPLFFIHSSEVNTRIRLARTRCVDKEEVLHYMFGEYRVKY